MEEIKIETLIEQLQAMKSLGAENVQLKGTLLCVENGNLIIASTEKQM